MIFNFYIEGDEFFIPIFTIGGLCKRLDIELTGSRGSSLGFVTPMLSHEHKVGICLPTRITPLNIDILLGIIEHEVLHTVLIEVEDLLTSIRMDLTWLRYKLDGYLLRWNGDYGYE